MHATRGGWLGPTFALAKSDDSSGGKKSQSRRSKDERKGMAETFIKRYQKLNNGNFPSLNLTRKEVGGSFYTVREIFREIIQENRVLAPPKSPPGDQNMENLDSFLEQYPLGSTSVDPHIHALPPKDTQTLLDEYEFRSAKVLNTRSITELHQGKLENDNTINGSLNTTERNEEVKDSGYTEVLVKIGDAELAGEEEIVAVETNPTSGADAVETTHATGSNEEFEEPENTELLNKREMGAQKVESKELETHQDQVHHLSKDVVVETFPLRPVYNTVHNIDGKSSERRVLDGDPEAEGTDENGVLLTGKNGRFVHDEVHVIENSTEVVDTKPQEEPAGQLPESKITLSSNHSSTEERDIKVEDTLPAENKVVNVVNGISAQNLDSKSSSSSLQQSTFDDTIANKNKSNDQPGGNSQKKRTDATLNRINLESWEAASKQSDGQETNPLVSFIKAFITTFVKFWSQ